MSPFRFDMMFGCLIICASIGVQFVQKVQIVQNVLNGLNVLNCVHRLQTSALGCQKTTYFWISW
jgi:hypothetical protein